MRLFKTLAGAAAALAVAAPAAAAEPSALLALDFLSQNDEVVYYLSSGTQQRQDDKVEFWVFVAEKQPQNVDGLEVVGLWFRQQVDCKADTLVVVEGLYSILGDMAPLREIAAVCRSHDAYLLVDEAHSFGTVGPRHDDPRGAHQIREERSCPRAK